MKLDSLRCGHRLARAAETRSESSRPAVGQKGQLVVAHLGRAETTFKSCRNGQDGCQNEGKSSQRREAQQRPTISVNCIQDEHDLSSFAWPVNCTTMLKCFPIGAAPSNALGGGWLSPTHKRTGRGSTVLHRSGVELLVARNVIRNVDATCGTYRRYVSFATTIRRSGCTDSGMLRLSPSVMLYSLSNCTSVSRGTGTLALTNCM